MAKGREIKNRLRTVRKIHQITRAMKMVAAVKLHRAQTALANLLPYYERMHVLFANLLAQLDAPLPPGPFFPQRPLKNILLIIVASDRGLCGSMNTNIFRHGLRVIDELNLPGPEGQKHQIHLFLIGRKAKDFFRVRQDSPVQGLPYRIREAINFAVIDAGQLGRECCELYRKGEFDRIEFIYNASYSALQQRPVRASLFPLDPERLRNATLPSGSILFEPACAAMLDEVIYGCIACEARKIVVEAEVAEHAARMLMMDQASRNAEDLISAIQLTMNKLRQLSITSELADITTGAEAVG